MVVLNVSMSLDGFMTGPHDDVAHPMGLAGERLHDWIFGGMTDRRGDAPRHSAGASSDAEVLDEMFRATGAVVMGRRTFEVGEGPWGDNPPFHVPCFVLTHRARAKLTKQGGTTFTFVTDGIESALKQARAAAADKNVSLMGANTAQQYLNAGLLDEIQIHLVPVLLGDGRRLFEHLGTEHIELESTRVIASPDVSHLNFRVVR